MTTTGSYDMAEQLQEDPEKVLRGFFEEMNRWEIESFAAVRSIPDDAPEHQVSDVYAPIGEKLESIFRKYCTPKPRPQGRQNSLAVGSPPDYEPETQQIIETIYEAPRRVLIDTVDLRRSNQKFRYVLLRKNERWLIDNKKFLAFDGKFERDYL